MIVNIPKTAQRMVEGIGANPQARLPISGAALKLLKQEPGKASAEVAKTLLTEVRTEYGNPKTRVAAAALAEEVKAFIRSQEPSVDRMVLC